MQHSIQRSISSSLWVQLQSPVVSKPSAVYTPSVPAPHTSQTGLDNQTVATIMNQSPDLIYLLFGRKSLISSTLFWQNLFSAETFASFIDLALWFLFSCKSEMIDNKMVVYRHLYSYTSVKCMVRDRESALRSVGTIADANRSQCRLIGSKSSVTAVFKCMMRAHRYFLAGEVDIACRNSLRNTSRLRSPYFMEVRIRLQI